MNPRPALFAPLLVALMAGCAPGPRPAAPLPPAQEAFWSRLQALCGRAFAGRVVADQPSPAQPDAFHAGPLLMHVRECGPDTVRIPFHVGDDRSRTWVIRRTAGGLQLKHDHRHADGSPDALTMYGGDTLAAGTAARQAFPADAESKALFLGSGRAVSVDNTWALEVEPSRVFIYELARPARLFRVEFDLTRPVPAPPPPWGAAD